MERRLQWQWQSAFALTVLSVLWSNFRVCRSLCATCCCCCLLFSSLLLSSLLFSCVMLCCVLQTFVNRATWNQVIHLFFIIIIAFFFFVVFVFFFLGSSLLFKQFLSCWNKKTQSISPTFQTSLFIYRNVCRLSRLVKSKNSLLLIFVLLLTCMPVSRNGETGSITYFVDMYREREIERERWRNCYYQRGSEKKVVSTIKFIWKVIENWLQYSNTV